MYYIENGLGKSYKPLAVFFAVSGVLCAYFGIGTFAQVNAIVEITQLSVGIPVIRANSLSFGMIKSLFFIISSSNSLAGAGFKIVIFPNSFAFARA